MYELSWTLRSKPEWQRKASDPDVRRKWRQDALEASTASDAPLTEKMVDNRHGRSCSQDFAWMPSDFTVDSEGAVKLASPYTNNLHPELHRRLYRSIE
ncbi:hypothetical protein DFH08DRAFT_829600 [Mycena albidolilacea]|uniref:DUF4246 domain-containing protein n=1 Tax=Mycena albidolilacea TaxID=1033008 RepID=A0AAD7ATS8_9AGAR|nr:hypothetical protein DFH08DRAFT_829600 [Mycena albidolilacea]